MFEFDEKQKTVLVKALKGLGLAVCAFAIAFIQFLEKEHVGWLTLIEIIVGFVILWVTSVLIALDQQTELTAGFEAIHSGGHSKILEEIHKSHKMLHSEICQIREVLPLYNQLLGDHWFLRSSQTLDKLLSDARGNVHDLDYFRDSLDKFMAERTCDVRSYRIDTFSREREQERVDRLKKIVKNSRMYVRAVTFDCGGYLERFWGSESFVKNYLSLPHWQEIESIKRVFVLQREVIIGKDRAKHILMTNVIRSHEENKLSIHIVGIDTVRREYPKMRPVSFLVCDGCVVSESYTLESENGKKLDDGYIAYHCGDKINQLNSSFHQLKQLVNEKWSV